jgi:hypothetical protein
MSSAVVKPREERVALAALVVQVRGTVRVLVQAEQVAWAAPEARAVRAA